MRLPVMWIVGTVLAAGCSASQSTAPGPADLAAAPIAASLVFSNSEAGLQVGSVSKSFDLAQLKTMWVRVAVPTLGTLQNVELTFKNPLGEAIYTLHRPYTTAAKMGPINMGNSPPAEVYSARPIPGGWAIDMDVSISGSMFTRFPTSAVGDWTVQAKIEGQDKAVVGGFTAAFGR